MCYLFPLISERSITLRPEWLLLHFHRFIFQTYSSCLLALLLIFNFLAPSSMFGRQHAACFFHTLLLSTHYSKALSLFITFLLFLSHNSVFPVVVYVQFNFMCSVSLY